MFLCSSLSSFPLASGEGLFSLSNWRPRPGLMIKYHSVISSGNFSLTLFPFCKKDPQSFPHNALSMCTPLLFSFLVKLVACTGWLLFLTSSYSNLQIAILIGILLLVKLQYWNIIGGIMISPLMTLKSSKSVFSFFLSLTLTLPSLQGIGHCWHPLVSWNECFLLHYCSSSLATRDSFSQVS